MIKLFRSISFLEGVSLLILLFIAMPLKYIWENPYYVKVVGMAHGILFIAYVFLALIVKPKLKWNIITLVIVLFASVIPFGTFYIDKKYLSEKH
jgi:integral membrane protein